MAKHWGRKQKRLHKKLYLEYRQKEVLWFLDVFLSVNHPQKYVDKFINDFVNNKRTVREMFTRVFVAGGDVFYNNAIPYEKDLKSFIGFMHYRQYIHVTGNMTFAQIMGLDRVFDLTIDERQTLRFGLLENVA